jgi:glucosylceramidase
MSRTRRDFLKTATAGMAAGMAAVSPSRARALSGAASDCPPVATPLRLQDAPSGTMEVRVTDARRKFVPAAPATWTAASQPAPETATPAEVITLDPGRTFQEHLGIGGAFTDAACFTFHRLSTDARAALFHEMFDPSEMGLSAGRICIGSSDYSTEVYSYDEGAPDPDLTRFSIDHDRAWILPILREARGANPDLWLLASPWSPPGWMKPNGSMLGGCMHPKSMPAYAAYFVKFLQAYEAEGVPINAVTSQNEVDTEQDGRMPACAWPQEYEISFISEHLGPALKKNKLDTAIWLLDHNYNLWGRVVCSLDDPGLREFCHSVAWHGYVGTPEMIGKVHEAYPDVEMYWTEGGPDYTAKDYLTDWCNWGVTFTGVFRNGCRCMIGWNLALDEHGKPNIGPFSCGGTVTIHSGTQEITRSGHFWAINHFARSVRRGARRFQSGGGPEGVSHAAYQNPDGMKSVVVTNPGPERRVQLQLGEVTAGVTLVAGSITTATWR